jgi:hypothetical protein
MSKEEVATQRNIKIGQRLNLVVGDVDGTTPLINYTAVIQNRRFYDQVRAAQFSSAELRTINKSVYAALRAGINVIGELRIKTIGELAQIDGIGRCSAHFLDEAFKHPTSP